MVIETFKDGKNNAVYNRFHGEGRMLPQGLHYIESWLEQSGRRCFQLMETDDELLFEMWKSHWNDLVEFEIVSLGDKP